MIVQGSLVEVPENLIAPLAEDGVIVMARPDPKTLRASKSCASRATAPESIGDDFDLSVPVASAIPGEPGALRDQELIVKKFN